MNARVARGLFGGCVLVCAAVACAGGRETSRTDSGAPGVAEELASKPPSDMSDTLRFELNVPSRVVVGESVTIVLRLTNVSPRPIEVHLLGRETVFDIVVRDAGGAAVWRRLDGENALAILALRPLAPGANMEFRHSWDLRDRTGAPLAPGTYQITGELPSDNPEPLRTSATPLTVVSR